MKIGLIASLVRPDGSTLDQGFVLDDALKLVDMGLEVHVFSRSIRNRFRWRKIWFHPMKPSTLLEYFKTVSELLKHLPVQTALRTPSQVLSDVLCVQSLREHIKDLDLIYAYSAYPEGLAAAIALETVKASLTVEVHGSDIDIKPDLGYGIRRYKGYDAAVRWILDRADAVIASSLNLYREASELLGSSSKLYLVSKGVDVDRFNPKTSGAPIRRRLGLENARVVFALDRHTRWCGFEDLIAAAAQVCRVRKDVVFLVGGDGPLRPYFEMLAADMRIRRRILFTGPIPRLEAPSYYAACDVFVKPSLVEENVTPVIEAMATGKPVIASDIEGLRELVADRVNGFLVSPKSVRLLADRILYLLENREEAGEMGVKARETVEKAFNLDDRVRRLIQIFEEVVRSK